MSVKHMPVTGGCSCGEVRYQISEPPINGGYCHCDQCQRAWGGLFSASLLFNESAFRFTKGEPNYYKSPLAKRGFCDNCGSPTIFVYDGDNKVWVLIGSLDYPGDWPFNKEGWFGHYYLEDKVPWEEIHDDLPKHQKQG